MLDQQERAELRARLRTEIDAIYRTGCCCDEVETPILAKIARHIGERKDRPSNVPSVLRERIKEQFGVGVRSEVADMLLGVDETRGLSKSARWLYCAELLKKKSGDSFRKSKDRGRSFITVILDEMTNALMFYAETVRDDADHRHYLEPAYFATSDTRYAPERDAAYEAEMDREWEKVFDEQVEFAARKRREESDRG